MRCFTPLNDEHHKLNGESLMNYTKQVTSLSLIIPLLLLSGCESTTKTKPGVLSNLISEANNSELAGKLGSLESSPDYLSPYLAENQKTGLRDQVLVNMKAGVAALQQGDYHITRRLMEDAYNRIETLYADNEAAKAARSNYVEEANKDFKGEPYERAMVGYYLGLSDMLSGDLQSAKSSFGWGEYQDTLSTNEHFQSDMSSLVFLRGWAKHCADEQASAQADFAASGINVSDNANLLVLIESGKAPLKYATGEHSEKLKFKAVEHDSSSTWQLNFDNTYFYPNQLEDLLHQATTRGGRPIDAILAGKAEFKETTKNVADSALIGAVAATTYSQAQAYSGDYNSSYNASMVGAALGLASLIANVMSENTVPKADTRQWENLPRFIFGETLRVNDWETPPQIILAGENTRTELHPLPTGKCYLAWHRVNS